MLIVCSINVSHLKHKTYLKRIDKIFKKSSKKINKNGNKNDFHIYHHLAETKIITSKTITKNSIKAYLPLTGWGAGCS